MSDTDDVLHPLGVSATTGQPLPSLSDDAIQAFGEDERARKPGPLELAQAQRDENVAFGVEGGIDAGDLSQTGWGVIFGPGTDQKIKDALQPLIDHRRSQGSDPLVIYDQDGFRSGESAFDWLKRRQARMDVVNPAVHGIPFYLLIVAPPDVIPFEFQYALDLYWAVGRLWFDTPDEFRQYADSVVAYETAASVPTARQMALFAPEHDFEPATQLFNRHVAAPLKDGQGKKPVPIGERQKFKLRTFLGEDATKEALGQIFGGGIPDGPPALLFSGGHGMAIELGDARQTASQGALVCQDWERTGAIMEKDWFAAADLSSSAKVHGLIHFMFACYGGGVPEFDNFQRLEKTPRRIAARPFLSRLPQALLGHPGGGALAVLAHVERAWAYSFQGDKGGSQIQGFRDVIGRLLVGERIGQATDTFNMRWAALSTRLAELHVDLQHGTDVPLKLLGQFWLARDDARNFMILGDPAVRIRVADLPALA